MIGIETGEKSVKVVFTDELPKYEARRSAYSNAGGDNIAEQARYSRVQGIVSDKFVRYGERNDLPNQIMELVLQNPLLLSLIGFKVDVAIGDGLLVYKQVGTKNKVPLIEVVEDSQVQDFILENDLDTFFETVFTDYYTFGIFTCEFIATRGALTNSGYGKKISLINAIDSTTVRPQKPATEFSPVNSYHINIDWSTATTGNTLVLPAYKKGIVQKKSVLHSLEYLPGNALMSLPKWIGAKEYIEYLNRIPTFKKALINNIATPSYHVRIPSDYFRINYPHASDKEIEKLREDLRTQIEKFLQGPENAGKPLITYIWKDASNRDIRLEIEAFKKEVGDQLFNEDFDQLFQIACSAMQVPPSIGSILVPGKLSSGSDITQSWNAMMARIARHRQKILNILRIVQRENGWSKALKFDFRTRELRTTDYAPLGYTDSTPQS